MPSLRLLGFLATFVACTTTSLARPVPSPQGANDHGRFLPPFLPPPFGLGAAPAALPGFPWLAPFPRLPHFPGLPGFPSLSPGTGKSP
ncbi:hypothetical protein NMY22_g17793 [Coprinellus aureogranulatus]|nr:hypothetical protein NMY22_g17793 [Coprinellus aureogranulatus]